MNIVIDPKLTKRLESVKLSPHRIFRCDPCKRTTERNGVKKVEGVYLCLICGKPVSVLEQDKDKTL